MNEIKEAKPELIKSKKEFPHWWNIIMGIGVLIALLVFISGSCYERNLSIDKEISLIEGLIAELDINTKAEAPVNYLIQNEESYSKGDTLITSRGITILLEETIKSGTIRNELILSQLIVLQVNYDDMNHNLIHILEIAG